MGQSQSVYRSSASTLEKAVSNLEKILQRYEDASCQVVLLENSDKTIRVIYVYANSRKIGEANCTLNPKNKLWAVYFKAGWEWGDGYLP